MKNLINLLSIIILAFCISLNTGCKKENFSTNSSNALRDGNPWSADARAWVLDSSSTFQLTLQGSEDERTNELNISFLDLFKREFRYDFDQSDEGVSADVILFAGVGGDATCDIYYLDPSVETNFLDIEFFSLESCLVRGSYDLTFKLDEDRGGSGCMNPTFGTIIRFSAASFEAELEGC